MKVSKVFNNNCIATLIDEQEVIVTGSGIGFQKKVGDDIDETRIEKTFKVMNNKLDEFEKLIKLIPIEYFELTRRIVEKANQDLKIELNDSITLALTDHIYYAVMRSREGIVLPGIFTDELKVFYPDETKVAHWARDQISMEFDADLPLDEVGYIAMHIVNARGSQPSYHAQETVFFLKEVIKIISEELNTEIDKDSIEYQRLTTHLKYLSKRIFGKDDASNMHGEDSELGLLIAAQFKDYDICIAKIASFVQQRFDYTLSREEKMYLTIHIHQIMKKQLR